jgi:hypothetical protein
MWFQHVNEMVELVYGMPAPQFGDYLRDCKDQRWFKVRSKSLAAIRSNIAKEKFIKCISLKGLGCSTSPTLKSVFRVEGSEVL